MANQLQKNPMESPRETIPHRRIEDNAAVIWHHLQQMRRELDILAYKAERENNIIYDLKCRMNSSDDRLEYRLSTLERSIQNNAQEIKDKGKDYWGIFASVVSAVTATVIIQFFANR